MIDAEKLAAFALVTATTSLVPGQSMLFVMGQAVWRGARSGWAALLGMQIGYLVWWVLVAFGLGTLAAAYPLAFRVLAFAGIGYLAWLGITAIRHSFHAGEETPPTARALIYMLAIIPPFVDTASPLGPQIILLAVLALVIDVPVGALYIGAGQRLARLMARAATRRWIDRGIGMVFLLIAALVLAELLGTKL